MTPENQPETSSHPSEHIIYEIARQTYREQFTQRESYRTQSGTLLAFAGVLAGLSVASKSVIGHSLWVGVGILMLVVAAALFFAVIAWFDLEATPRLRPLFEGYAARQADDTRLHLIGNLIDAVETNEKTLEKINLMYTLGALMLLVGTVIVGVRVALMVV